MTSWDVRSVSRNLSAKRPYAGSSSVNMFRDDRDIDVLVNVLQLRRVHGLLGT